MTHTFPVLTLLGLLATPLWGGAIKGSVVLTDDGSPVPGVEVAFFTSQSGQATEIVRKATDDDGRFSLSGPFLTPDLTFVLVALYKGVPYPSSELRIGEQSEIILEVSEPTADDAGLRFLNHTIVFTVSGTRVDVGHFAQVENPGDQTYVGQGAGEERHVLEFALPEGLFNMTGTLHQGGSGRFFDNRPVPPGLSQVSFNFQVAVELLEDGYRHQPSYATEQLDVYVRPASREPGPPFQDLGTTLLHGDEYRLLRLTGMAAGQQVLIPLPLPQDLRSMLKWIALGCAVLAGFLVGVGRPTNASEQSLEERREQLLSQLASLEDDRASLGEARYGKRRERLMQETVAVYGLLEARRA